MYLPAVDSVCGASYILWVIMKCWQLAKKADTVLQILSPLLFGKKAYVFYKPV